MSCGIPTVSSLFFCPSYKLIVGPRGLHQNWIRLHKFKGDDVFTHQKTDNVWLSFVRGIIGVLNSTLLKINEALSVSDFTIKTHFILSPMCRLRSFFLTDRSHKHLIERVILKCPRWFFWAHNKGLSKQFKPDLAIPFPL